MYWYAISLSEKSRPFILTVFTASSPWYIFAFFSRFFSAVDLYSSSGRREIITLLPVSSPYSNASIMIGPTDRRSAWCVSSINRFDCPFLALLRRNSASKQICFSAAGFS